MNELSSVLELAHEVTRQAIRIREGSELENDVKRVITQADETKAELVKLRQAVAAARGFAAASGEAGADLSGLDNGLVAFASNATSRGGLPTRPAFNTAQVKIREVTVRINSELAEAWTRWINREMGTVPTVRISMLEPAQQGAARERQATLNRLAKVTTPTSVDITEAKNALEYLSDLLKNIPDPPGQVVALLDRLSRQPDLTLADLTDEDIKALRGARVADQIVVRRRGA